MAQDETPKESNKNQTKSLNIQKSMEIYLDILEIYGIREHKSYFCENPLP